MAGSESVFATGRDLSQLNVSSQAGLSKDLGNSFLLFCLWRSDTLRQMGLFRPKHPDDTGTI